MNAENKKKRGGRPPKPEAEKRSFAYGFRCNQAESIELNSRAAIVGLTAGEFARECALTRRLPSPAPSVANTEAWSELRNLAVNLNQLTKAVNAGRVTAIDPERITDLIHQVDELRAILLTGEVSDDR